jgi:hypothetical protein
VTKRHQFKGNISIQADDNQLGVGLCKDASNDQQDQPTESERQGSIGADFCLGRIGSYFFAFAAGLYLRYGVICCDIRSRLNVKMGP